MTDKTELKRLAEAAPGGPWVTENDSLYFKDGGYTRHLLDADAGHDVEPEAYYAALQFIAAANPAAVLALIAENEQLAAQVRLAGVSAEMTVHQAVGRAATDTLLIMHERDQLKTENDALKAKRLARAARAKKLVGIASSHRRDALVLRKELESHKRMLLAAACDLGAIGEALKSDMDADGEELLGMIIDLKAQNTRMLEWLKDISRTSGDKGAVMGARQLLKEFAE